MFTGDTTESVLDRLLLFRKRRKERNRIKAVYRESIHHLKSPTWKLKTKTVAFPTPPGFKTRYLGNELEEKQGKIKTLVAKLSLPSNMTAALGEEWYRDDEDVRYYAVPPEHEEAVEEMLQGLINDIQKKNRNSIILEVGVYFLLAGIMSLLITLGVI